ncbi:MAG TPA: MlaD family protein [Thermoanaerobaculia bacterium]|nr:MlaD family protein [Thermoanaerobaculia bacterium]
MSEYDDLPERRKPAHAEAAVHTSRWGPWVWVVPVLAIFFVGYLIVRYGFFGGGDITVRFAEARGLDRYSPVRFRGAKVGTVQKITVDEDLKGVVVRISMDASMNHALRKGTKFWIVEPGLEGGGIGSILSGTYVGIEPGTGEETREFVGQEIAPVLSAPEAGKTFILEGRGAGSVAAGSPVTFNGIRVGRILGAEYDAARAVTSVHAFVQQRYVHHVRQSTRWWRGGGFNVALSGGGISLGGGGLTSFLSAPVAFYTPDVLAGAEVAERTRFVLHDSEGAAIASADGPHLTYLTYFPGSIAGLKPGTPVTMKGVQIGRVREVRLRYLPEERALQTPVMLEIDPRQMEIPVTNAITRDVLRADINDVLDGLIRKGMRATLATSLVLPGASAVQLEFVARAGTGRLVTENEPPIIPAGGAGDGIAGAMAAITDVANTIRGLPLREIAADIQSTTRRLNQIVNDPALNESLQRLNRSMAEVERVAGIAGANAEPIVTSLRNAAESAEATAKSVEATAATASQNVAPIVESLRNAAASAEAAAKRAEQLMGTSQKQNYDIAELIRELTRAAEAVRALATYFTENPDAVIKGRRE